MCRKYCVTLWLQERTLWEVREIKICDICKKEIIGERNEVHITITSNGLTAKYDACSSECASKIFSLLSEKWNDGDD